MRSVWRKQSDGRVSTNNEPQSYISFLIHAEHINTQEDTTTNKNSSSYICRGDVLSYPELPINNSTYLAAVALAVRPRAKHLCHHPHHCSLWPAVAPLHRPCCQGDDGEGGQDQKQHGHLCCNRRHGWTAPTSNWEVSVWLLAILFAKVISFYRWSEGETSG